jgi:hypothetical protein
MKVFQYIQTFLPDLLELIRIILEMSNSEFEDISKTWPAPIKTKLAKMRFEARLMEEFPDSEGE